jgi:hypothetical protein
MGTDIKQANWIYEAVFAMLPGLAVQIKLSLKDLTVSCAYSRAVRFRSVSKLPQLAHSRGERGFDSHGEGLAKTLVHWGFLIFLPPPQAEPEVTAKTLSNRSVVSSYVRYEP